MNNAARTVVDRWTLPLLPRRRAIPKSTTRQSRIPAAHPRRKRASTGASPKRRRPRSARPRRAEQPLGVGVADAFALKRLNIPPQPSRARAEKGVREIGWAEFGEVARELAERIGQAFRPDVVLGIVNGGVFLGGALAAPLDCEFHPVRVEKRGKRTLVAERLEDVQGKAVLVADDVTVSGATLRAVSAAARKAGAGEIRTATLVVRPSGNHSDYYAVETNDIIVFGWDYQLHGDTGAEDPGDVGV